MEMTAYYKGHTDAIEGVSKSTGNTWRKVTGIFETVEHFPKTIAVTGMGSLCEQILTLTRGKLYRVRFDIESRSWTGNDGVEKWFTDCKAWDIAEAVPAAAPGIQAQPVTVPAGGAQAVGRQTRIDQVPPTNDEKDDLPF